MIISNKFKKVIYALTIISLFFIFSSYIAKNFYGTDFPVYYEAARKIVDPQYSIKDIYQKEMQEILEFPEKNPPGNFFIYSPVIAVVFSPLGFFPYYMAKSTLIFLNILSYVIAIALLLKQINHLTWLTFISAISFTWMPFLINICVAQVNGIVLLLIVGAVYVSKQRKHRIAGSLLGFAALFKIFPLGIAFIMGFSNRKITLACFSVFILTLIFPGTWQWFQAMPTVSAGFTPVYLYLKQHGIGWQLLFASLIGFVSLLCIFRSKTKDLLTLCAYSIPAAFVAMPVVQYHHFLILTITYIIIFYAKSQFYNNILLRIFSIFTILHINLSVFWDVLPNSYWSMFLMWAILSWGVFNSKAIGD